MKTRALAFCLLLFGSGLQAHGQYAIDWWTVDGGGGASTGGVYAVTGTMGQPEAGRMSGGSFTLEGGFWSILAANEPPAPTLQIVRLDGSVIISWTSAPPGSVLEANAGLSPSGWSPVSGGDNSPVTVPITPGTRFFRLRR
jgi:hypothetical protein